MNNQRYLRNNLVDWFSQDELINMNICIVGCGAVGNEVIKNLALMGVGNLDIYDFDKIEIHNLTKSVLFRESDIGRMKSDVAAERAKELDPNINVSSYPGDFWDLLPLNRLQKYDCVICCVDNFEARLKINQLCVLFSKDLINTGIDSRYASIEIYPFSKNCNTACYECNLPQSVYKQIEKRYSCGWLKKISYKEKIIPTTPITASSAGSIATSFSLRMRNSPIFFSKRILIDTFSGVQSTTDLLPNDKCITCHPKRELMLLKSPREIKTILSSFHHNFIENLVILSSEPIITKTWCLNCQPKGKQKNKILQVAKFFDSRLSICSTCGNNSNHVEIKDVFNVNELVKEFRGYKFPGKFITTTIDQKIFIFELED